LQSAAVGFSYPLFAFSLEADCKSALKWSSLFGLRISNPQERLAGLRFLLSPGGLAFLLPTMFSMDKKKKSPSPLFV
jgi:hypothetical protein